MNPINTDAKKLSFSNEAISFSFGLLGRRDSVPLDTILGVIRYRNLLLIDHEGGSLFIHGELTDRQKPILDALKALPDCHYEEIDAKHKLEDNPTWVNFFYLVATIAIAVAIHLASISDDSETQPITITLYLIPAFCIAFLARHGFRVAVKMLPFFRAR